MQAGDKQAGFVPARGSQCSSAPSSALPTHSDPFSFHPTNLSPASPVLGEVTEGALLEITTSQMEQAIGKKQHPFTEGRRCLTNLMASYKTGTSSVEVGRAVVTADLAFSKQTAPRSLL